MLLACAEEFVALEKCGGGGGGERGVVRSEKPAPAGSTEVVHHRVVAPGADDRDGGKNANTNQLVNTRIRRLILKTHDITSVSI